jgi:DNA polymerase V
VKAEHTHKIVNRNLLVKRINICVCDLSSFDSVKERHEQIDIFSDFDHIDNEKDKKKIEDENKLQHVMLDIKKKYGKNSILKAMDLSDGATTIDRNKQIGGHRE